MGDTRERVTRADVAKMAGVSETIVSYVINNNRYVAKEKRQRVEEAVRLLNYRPNNVARALKGKRSNQIIFIADHITNEYFSSIVSEMDKYAYDSGYLISLCSNRNTPEFISQVISRQFDGIIVSSASFPTEYVEQFSQAGIPVVVFRRWRHQKALDHVAYLGTGLYTGAREAVKHLIDRGCRNVVYVDRISAKGHISPPDDMRFSGFVDEMEANGFTVGPDNIICGCRSQEDLAEEVKRRLRTGSRVDGIFGRNDMLACIAMTAAGQIGIQVPGQLKVIGFDDSSISRLITPGLSTIQMRKERIAQAAIDMLTQMIAGRQPENRDFETVLIERDSTRNNSFSPYARPALRYIWLLFGQRSPLHLSHWSQISHKL